MPVTVTEKRRMENDVKKSVSCLMHGMPDRRKEKMSCFVQAIGMKDRHILCTRKKTLNLQKKPFPGRERLNYECRE